MKIVITGAGGYIGRRVVRYAVNAGHDVVCIVYPGSSESVFLEGVKIVELDLLNADQNEVDAVFTGSDACLHLAWQSGFNHQDPCHINNVLKHYHFIEKVINSGIKNISVAGTMHEIGYHVGPVNENTTCEPINPYGIAKNFLRQAALNLCVKQGVNIKWLRMYYIIGDDKYSNSIFTKILAAAENGKSTFPLNSGEMLYDFINIEDLVIQLVDATIQTKYTGIINCSSGKPVSLRTAVERFIKNNELDIKPEYNKFPNRQYDSYAIWGDAEIINKITIGNKLLNK